MAAAFGAPAPLPGQPGFRARPSESMARETAEMEERLSRLKTDLAVEAEMREAAGPKAGGARWRSARIDRGSVRAYAKDVKTRHKQQLQKRPPHGIFASATSGGGAGLGGSKGQPQAGAGARAAAALRDEQQQRQQQQYWQQQARDEAHGSSNPAPSRSLPLPQKSAEQGVRPTPAFANKEVTVWGVGDTLGWLDSLGLEKYRSVFQQNEISGTILLEVGLDDLDYMDVRVLAHRKRILKGIEDLRRGGGKRALDANMPPPPAPALELLPNQTTSSTSSVKRDGQGARTGEGIGRRGAAAVATSQIAQEDCRGVDRRCSPPSGGKKQHWSTIEPLSENQRDGGGGLSPPAVNLADGQYDESAASSSFKDAVAEWRGEGKYSITTSATEGQASSLHRPTVVGRAPLAGMPSTAQEEKDEDMQLVFNAKPARPGLLGRREGGRVGMAEETECWVNPFSSPRVGEKGGKSQLVDLGLEPGAHGTETETETETLKVAGFKQEEAREKGHDPALALDEEAEHEAFRKAVAEWNRGKNTGVTAESGSGGDGGASRSGIGSSITSAETATEVVVPSRRTAEAMAEELRKQMDAEHCSQAKELEEEKRALLEGLERSRDGKTKGDQLKLGAPDEGTEVEEQDDDASSWREEEDVGSGSVPSSSVSSSTGRSSSPECQATERESLGCGHDSGGVEIEVMESVLGADLSIEGGVSYVVDEGDGGDEPHF